MLDQRGQLMRTALRFAGCSMPSNHRAFPGMLMDHSCDLHRAREKEIGDEDVSCSTAWGRVRYVPASWSCWREAGRRRQGTGGELAGVGHRGAGGRTAAHLRLAGAVKINIRPARSHARAAARTSQKA